MTPFNSRAHRLTLAQLQSLRGNPTPTPIRPQDDFLIDAPHAVDSWRADAYDPAVDDEAPPAPKTQIELLPGVWIYPEHYFGHSPHRDLIREDDYSDLGSDDWS